jgi:hypothetical protein
MTLRRRHLRADARTGSHVRLSDEIGAARRHSFRRHCSDAVTRGRAIAFTRQKSGRWRCGTGPLARHRLAPLRREITFGRQRNSPMQSAGTAKAITQMTRAKYSGRDRLECHRDAESNGRSWSDEGRTGWPGALVGQARTGRALRGREDSSRPVAAPRGGRGVGERREDVLPASGQGPCLVPSQRTVF